MKRVLFAGLLLLAVATPASAAPMSSTFTTIRSQTIIVALGVVTLGPTGDITLDVDKVVRGSAHVGKMTLNQSPDGHVTVSNERVVAFIDGTNALRWVGRLAAGATLETGVIKLQGFFDFNAHLVTPGLMTLPQIDSTLRTGTLTQTFEATLAFPDGHGALHDVPTRHFTVTFDPFTRSVVSLGTFAVPCLGNPSLFGLEWGQFELHFTDTCLTNGSNPSRVRSLSLDGQLMGVGTTGAINVRIVPTRPFMTEAQYDAFVRDRDITDMVSQLSVTPQGGPSWTWRLEQSLVDPQGKVHDAGGASSSLTDETYDFDGGMSVTFSRTRTLRIGGDASTIVQEVDAGAISSCMFKRPGQVAVSCALTHGQPLWVRR